MWTRDLQRSQRCKGSDTGGSVGDALIFGAVFLEPVLQTTFRKEDVALQMSL